MTDYSIQQSDDSRWIIRREGILTVGIFKDKDQAIESARKIVRKHDKIVVTDVDGNVATVRH